MFRLSHGAPASQRMHRWRQRVNTSQRTSPRSRLPVGSTTWVYIGETATGARSPAVTTGDAPARVFPLKRPRGWVTRPIDPRFSLKLRKITRIKGNLGRTYVFERLTRVRRVGLAQISSSWYTACGSLRHAPFIFRRQHAVKPSGLYAIQPDLDQTGSFFCAYTCCPRVRPPGITFSSGRTVFMKLHRHRRTVSAIIASSKSPGAPLIKGSSEPRWA